MVSPRTLRSLRLNRLVADAHADGENVDHIRELMDEHKRRQEEHNTVARKLADLKEEAEKYDPEKVLEKIRKLSRCPDCDMSVSESPGLPDKKLHASIGRVAEAKGIFMKEVARAEDMVKHYSLCWDSRNR